MVRDELLVWLFADPTVCQLPCCVVGGIAEVPEVAVGNNEIGTSLVLFVNADAAECAAPSRAECRTCKSEATHILCPRDTELLQALVAWADRATEWRNRNRPADVCGVQVCQPESCGKSTIFNGFEGLAQC